MTGRAAVWTGRVMSALVILFLLFDAGVHLARIQPVVDAFARLGLSITLSVALGILEIVCVALYAIPRSAVVGAILLTGYLGGAVAINLRAGSPFFYETLFPVYVGVLVWGGLWLRDPRVRGIIR